MIDSATLIGATVRVTGLKVRFIAPVRKGKRGRPVIECLVVELQEVGWVAFFDPHTAANLASFYVGPPGPSREWVDVYQVVPWVDPFGNTKGSLAPCTNPATGPKSSASSLPS